MIAPRDEKYYVNVKHITRPIVKALIAEYQYDKYDASDAIHNSKTFSELADRTTGLYQKQWTEIYDALKRELNLY